MTELLVIAGLIGGIALLAWMMGRQGVRKDEAKAVAKVKDEQLKIAADRPDRRELVERLRDSKF